MFRLLRAPKVLVIAATAVALTTLAVPASAATAAPTGTLACPFAGTIAFKPALPVAPGPKNVRFSVRTASAPCDYVEQSGGKSTITNATFSLTATLPKATASCSDWAAGTIAFTNMKMTIKLTTVTTTATGKTKRTTVATLRPTITSQSPFVFHAGLYLDLMATVPQNTKGNAPFGGENASINVAASSVDAASCGNRTGPVSKVTIPADGQSRFLIQPHD